MNLLIKVQSQYLLFLIIFLIITAASLIVLSKKYNSVDLEKKFNTFFNVKPGNLNFRVLTDHIAWLMLILSLLDIVPTLAKGATEENTITTSLGLLLVTFFTLLIFFRAYGDLALNSMNLSSFKLLCLLVTSFAIFSLAFYGYNYSFI